MNRNPLRPPSSAPRHPLPELQSAEWVALPGGELEVRRPKQLCARCEARPGTLCFDCHRAALVRERRLKAAGTVDTGSAARFQEALPFEPIDHGRLEMLKVSRMAARDEARVHNRFADRRRQAQLAARHALQQVMHGLKERQLTADPEARAENARATAAAIHAAELQLPESWIPFVVGQ